MGAGGMFCTTNSNVSHCALCFASQIKLKRIEVHIQRSIDAGYLRRRFVDAALVFNAGTLTNLPVAVARKPLSFRQ